MRVAVLSLTRDRLAYTQHCFASLAENAGCDYDHWVLDQASKDGTVEWLKETNLPVIYSRVNMGISHGTNRLLNESLHSGEDYDVIVRFDNDCELTTPNTLRDICDLVDRYGLMLAPQILGLRNPPPTLGRPISLGGTLVDEKAQIGGIFMATPASLYDEFRFSELNLVWGGDDTDVCSYWRAEGGQIGYVQGYEAWHYLSTEGQWADQPQYFARTLAEGKAAL